MTYNPAVPLNSDSPSLLPGQCQANFTRLQTLVGADHQFNLTAAANDGYHNLVHLTQQAPTGALAGVGRLYAKTVSGIVQLFYMTSAGVEIQVTPGTSTAGVFAAVNFDGRGPVVIRSQSNVTSVSRISTGVYRVAFTIAASNNNYIVQATGQRDDAAQDKVSNACIISRSSYGVSQTTTQVDLGFFGSGESFRDVLAGNVIIYQV